MDDNIIEYISDEYRWPQNLSGDIKALLDIESSINKSVFADILKGFDPKKSVYLTVVSYEYISIGEIWLRFALLQKNKQILVITTDSEVAAYMNSKGVKSFIVPQVTNISDSDYLSKTGFNYKGLFTTALKFPFVKLVLEHGLNVFLTDVDALLLSDPDEESLCTTDIAFQRVLYFPKSVVKKWSFAACSGFVWFRACSQNIKFLKKVIEVQSSYYSDQMAFNITLYESNTVWDHKAKLQNIEDPSWIKSAFIKLADLNIRGYNNDFQLRVCALSPLKYWRNDIISLDFSVVSVFHPNSPKNQADKIKTFRDYGIL